MSAAADLQLVQIVDAAFADAAERSGSHLACRPGCTQCCIGVFAISQLDAQRLRGGLAELENTNGATRIRQRAHAALSRLAPDFPGDAATGTLGESQEEQEAFENFGNDEPCPALCPETGLCELYAARPVTCRVFGVPLRDGDGIGVCELCFHGASDDEIAACELHSDADALETTLTEEIERSSGRTGKTIVAFALAR